MNNRNAPHFDEVSRPRGCDRAEEFVTYLYGEATPEEAGGFRKHLSSCAVCREELAAFGGVREVVGEWRAEARGSLLSLDIKEVLAPANEVRQAPEGFRRTPAGEDLRHAPAEIRQSQERKRSAVAALSEFFSLSPLWLRAGALAATLVVCTLAALTLARSEIRWDANGLAFRTGVTQRVVVEQAQAPAQSGYTKEQVNAIVAERLDAAKAQWEATQPHDEVVNVSGELPRKSEPRTVVRLNAARPKHAAPRGLDRDEELADLPRLSDLLSGGN
jgi:hypothetical protein